MLTVGHSALGQKRQCKGRSWEHRIRTNLTNVVNPDIILLCGIKNSVTVILQVGYDSQREDDFENLQLLVRV